MSKQSRLEPFSSDIIDMYRSGKTTIEIGKKYNCNSGTVWVFLNNKNIIIKTKKMNVVKNNMQNVLNLWIENMSAYAIAKKINISIDSVIRILKKNNIDTSKFRTVNPDNLLIDKKDEVIKLFVDGNNCCQIEKILGFSNANIWKLLVKEGYKPTKIKYNLDETFFEKIDTEAKAYVLGWWYSDGNVMPSGKCRLTLKEDDKEILEIVRGLLKYDGELRYVPARNTSKPQWELCIDRKKVSQDLIKLGCIPNKSMNLKFPTNDIIPDNLLSHFIRGYFDGDGSIGNGVMIVGTYEFTHKLSDMMPCEVTNIYPRYKNRPLLETSHQLFIGRGEEIDKFYQWIYKDAHYFLKRKHDGFPIRCANFGV